MVQFSHLRAQVNAAAPCAVLPPEAEVARAMLTPAMVVALEGDDRQPGVQRTMAAIVAEDAYVQRAAAAGTDIAALLKTLRQDMLAEDPEELIEEAYEVLTDAMALRAFSYALRIAHADGDVDPDVQGTLRAWAEDFGVAPAQVSRLLQSQTSMEGRTP